MVKKGMILSGKKALITGGSGGIGRVLTEEFLKEGAFVFIVALAKHTPLEAARELAKQYPNRIFASVGDISDAKEAERIVAEAHGKLGGIDILVNVAGIHGAIGPLWEAAPEAWELALRTNLYGTVYMIQSVLPFMIAGGHGKIINFAGGGATSSRPFFTSYAASKTAVVRVTEILADELREKGHRIEVNAISPGAINTTILDDIINAGPEKAGKHEFETIQKIKREGGEDPKKAAALAVFLASSLSDGLSGRLLSAIHDNWRDIPHHLKEIMDSDIYTLRRIKPSDRGKNWK